MQLSRIHATLRAYEFTIFVSVPAQKSFHIFRRSCIRIRLDAHHNELQHRTDAAERGTPDSLGLEGSGYAPAWYDFILMMHGVRWLGPAGAP